MYVKWLDTVMLYYQILIEIFEIPAGSAPPVRPGAHREWKTDAGIGRRRWPGSLQGN
ncbi:unnamed protein product, partial [Staurois parvus]